MAYILIVIGALLIIVGGIMLFNKSKLPQETPQHQKAKPTFDENKAKGDAFESFIVKQFNKKYFTLQEWRGDKYVDGNYPVSNHFPDLEVSFELKDTKDHFAIECKWRKDYFKGAIDWAEDYQLNNYKEYAQKTKLPVFVVIGVGGEPANPKELFIIPLKEIQFMSLYKKTLEPYRKEVGTNLYWDNENKMLR